MGSHVGGSGKILFQCRMKQKDIKSKVLTLQKVAVDGDPLILMFMSSIKKGVHRCSNHSADCSSNSLNFVTFGRKSPKS